MSKFKLSCFFITIITLLLLALTGCTTEPKETPEESRSDVQSLESTSESISTAETNKAPKEEKPTEETPPVVIPQKQQGLN